MPELSLNILDLVENSYTAGAALVEIRIEEQTTTDTLIISIRDNGNGMESNSIRRIPDPFYSSKKGKEWGLGVPFMKQTADLCDGTFEIISAPGSGTEITVTVSLSHIDLPPLGNLTKTIVTIVSGHSDRDLSLILRRDSETYGFSTVIIRKELDGISLTDREVLDYIERDIDEGMRRLEFMQ